VTFVPPLLAALLLGCGSVGLKNDEQNAPAAQPADYGLGDGSLASVELASIYRPGGNTPLSATALAFNASAPNELWITLRQFPSGKPCTDKVRTGCDALEGMVAILSDATLPAPSAVIKEDGNAWHFMRRPTAIAWGDGELFSSCGEALTDNFEDVAMPYAGPVLWSSDPAIFGVPPKAGQNGTHIDMLHETPYCMGVTHEAGNAFWAVNGDAGSLDRYDFHKPHVIGGEDHSDGEIYRYIPGELLRLPEVPSHAAYAAKTGLIYVADTGHGRVISVDPTTASSGPAITVYETLVASGSMLGATVSELVPPGVLQKPSGLALVNEELLYVTDNATSVVHVFDLSGKELLSLATGLPPGSLAGIAVGPDHRLYLTDLSTGGVWRIQPPP
jgi:hypothetical protein